MNFYKHHIGDYDSHTAHLTWLEDAAYSRLMRLYYRTEQPIPADLAKACRLVRASTKQERDAVDIVLKEFFTLEADGWHSRRCDEEIASAQAKADKNREVGKKGGRPRKAETTTVSENNHDGFQTKPTDNPNQTPDTRHQTPEQENNGAAAPEFDLHEAFALLWSAWPTGYGEKGSRKNAEAQFLKIKPDRDLFAVMQCALDAQARDKASRALQGQFVAPFQHVERWIKNQRWTDEIEPIAAIGNALAGSRAHAGPTSGVPLRESTVDRNSRKADERIAEIDAELAALGEVGQNALEAHG